MGRRTVLVVAVLLAAVTAADLHNLLRGLLDIARRDIVVASMAGAGLLCLILAFASFRGRFRK
jgi:hypothetical protein